MFFAELTQGKRGFSLIELLIVFAIIGVLVLISMPAIRIYQHNLETSGVIRDLMANLRYAQQLAVTEQVEHGVYFITADKKYQVRRYGTATSTIKEVILPSEITEITVSGLTDANGDKEARYNPIGAVRDAGSVMLKNSQGATTTIEIRPSGFIKKD